MIDKAIAEQSFEKYKRALHSQVSTSAFIGMDSLCNICQELEEKCDIDREFCSIEQSKVL
ncbi:Hpt domain-containing protein [Candidatus Enterovibrio escicola]|uniref:Hpt domain-containing protein n=1 Tax=Candidatus Enterovibrio escicola TaxID=1927127 RepID=UPI001237B3ED